MTLSREVAELARRPAPLTEEARGGSAEPSDRWIADSEHLSFAVQRTTPPPQRREEFQRSPAWRRAVVHDLDSADAAATIIVPQALLDYRGCSPCRESSRWRSGDQVLGARMVGASVVFSSLAGMPSPGPDLVERVGVER